MYPRLLPALLALFLSVVVSGCTTLFPGSDATPVRFAVLGDAEPKPKAAFPNVEAAVQDVNKLAKQQKVEFVLGVGDIAHKGTLLQYDNVTPVLQQLSLPFYPIMGNEEHGSTVDRFLQYATRWNNGKIEVTAPSYVLEQENVAIVMASPDFGRDFNDSGITWMLEQIEALSPKPVLLVVHGAQAGIYPERADKGIKHPGFSDVVAQPNLTAVISGDLHMDMDRVVHSKQIDGVHYLHIPALERTKIPDESRHNPMFRVFNVHADGTVTVDTYQVGLPEPLQRHAYQFDLRR
ncbi:metallophosphoesterase family protein [Marinobacter lacisalsi]|uniref:Metallophosphoesterase family protein n=1 Tax=Marinobacter lacisalsi TaxID=475979 RepID=A0ABV8QMX7_9GAMM